MFELDFAPHYLPEADRFIQEAAQCRIDTDKKCSYYSIPAAFDIETTSFTDDGEQYLDDWNDTTVFDHLKGTTIKVPRHLYNDIPDLGEIRRAHFGRLFFSKDNGIAIDSLFRELCEIAPYYFNEDEYTHPADQLDRIVEIFDMQSPQRKEHINTKRSIMYVWQFGINGHCIIGRTWEQFLILMSKLNRGLKLSDDLKLIVYCHNLSMEFQYIRKLLQWNKVFSIDTRKPVYADCTLGIEFRCSYILTNYSLNDLAGQLHKYEVKKLTGDLDYTELRHPMTPLTDKELQYCINDVLVVMAYIQEQIEIERKIFRIPLTCTGYCRRYVRKACLYGDDFKTWRKQYHHYKYYMNNLQITGIEEYNQLQRAFQGGFTHTAFRWWGLVVSDVDSIDFTSSYPYALLSEKRYPMSSAKEVTPANTAEFEYYLKHYCCLFDLKLYDVKPKFEYENYISASKCWVKKNATENNGRIYTADELIITVTEVDLEIIDRDYYYSKREIANMKIYKRGYLPKEILLSIQKLYADKTMLKGIAGMETQYQISKGLLNSVYGMMVTNIVRDDVVYSNELDEWQTENADPQDQIDRYNRSWRRFLFYPWGIWCTALSRRNLWTGIFAFGKDYIYADTDSIKCVHMSDHQEFIDDYNELCETKLKMMCAYYKLDYETLLLPKTVKGTVKPLGVWDHDAHYDYFKAIGAKRYMYLHDGELSLTVSGVNKKIAAPYLKDKYGIMGAFDQFNNGLLIPEEYTGKLTHTYIDDTYEGDMVDYKGNEYHYIAYSGIFFDKASYDFSMDKYLRFLKGVKMVR